MCEHEDKPCPGRSCRCVCDNCVLDFEDDRAGTKFGDYMDERPSDEV